MTLLSQQTVVSYRVPVLPDPSQTDMNLRFGNPQQVIADAWMSLVRTLSELPAASLSLKLCFLYQPDLSAGVQGRLRLWIQAQCNSTSAQETAQALIMNGPLAVFYGIKEPQRTPEQQPDHSIPWQTFSAAAEITRRGELILPYLPRHLNDRIPEGPYATLHAFEPKEDNDYTNLDRLLAGFQQPAYLELLICPSSAETEVSAVYKAISNLSRINESDYGEVRLSQEVLRQQSGFRRDHLAEEILRDHETLAENLRRPQLEFCFRCFTHSLEQAYLLGSTVAESGLSEGKYRLLVSAQPERVQQQISACQSGTVLHDWQHDARFPKAIRRLTHLATVEELHGIYRLPVAARSSPLTIRKSTDPQSIPTKKRKLLIGDDMEAGVPAERMLDQEIATVFQQVSSSTIEHHLELEQLKKHMFISGVPGSGKTTAIQNLMIQLQLHNIPFLIIEPAKTEYRKLKLLTQHSDPLLCDLGTKLQVYTPGAELISPFRFNPMAFPQGISTDEHISSLMNCFRGAMPLPADTPLPALLADAVELVYADFEQQDEPKQFPNLEMLVGTVKELMAGLNYDAEIKSNLETAIQVRLSPLVRRSIGKVFKASEVAPSISQLMTTPTLIEMDALDQEQANLLTLFILTAAREHIKSTRRSGSKLQHVIILEEAHNIVGRIPEGADPGDPRVKAADYVSRMLAELRALGEGIVIADQLPSTVASNVVKNTGTKLTHRLTSMDDREEIGHTMLLDGAAVEELARLRVGEAFYYTEGLYQARRVRCLDSNHILQIDQPPDNQTLSALLEADDWYRIAAQEDYQLLIDNIGILLNALMETNGSSPENAWYDLSTCNEQLDTLLHELPASKGLSADWLATHEQLLANLDDLKAKADCVTEVRAMFNQLTKKQLVYPPNYGPEDVLQLLEHLEQARDRILDRVRQMHHGIIKLEQIKGTPAEVTTEFIGGTA